MSTLPLIAHRRPDAVVAWRGSTPVSVRQFLGEVAHVAVQLPPGRHVLNLCGDRYLFTVALAACIVSGRISLLPSTHTPEMVRQMQRIAPDVFCIVDQGARRRTAHLPLSRIDAAPGAGLAIPAIDCEQVVAQVFTSGSTGVPVPHAKRWGSLVRNVRAEAERLGIGADHAILGTVPPQHMYGLESTVLMPLQSGAALHAGHPFYPADICAALASLPRPRVLVTTPYHLRALLADQATLPAARPAALGHRAAVARPGAMRPKRRFGAPLHEIYGCTETGQLASRRTAAGLEWHTLADVRLRREGPALWAEGGHIDSADLPRRCHRTHRRRLGVDHLPAAWPPRRPGQHRRQAHLAGLPQPSAERDPGVRTASSCCRDEDSAGHASRRLAALVVAPGLTPAALTQALRERIDPVFLPRPLLFVDALPRNATGKLPSQIAQDLLATLQAAGRDRDAGMSEHVAAPAHRRRSSGLCRALSRPAHPSRRRAAR